MPLRSKINEYQGVNAHLNSILQNVAGEWESFQASHIVDIARVLNQRLPEGYEARVEKSLQIRETVLRDDVVRERRRAPQPDVTAFKTSSIHPRAVATPMFATAVTSPLLEVMDLENDELLSAVVIYRISEDTLIGKPVTRLELLSPANKPRADSYEQYREKRNATLNSGMPLVEIDYLHQTPPVAPNRPSYADHDPNAHAFAILVSDPRPSLQDGIFALYDFDVEQPIPSVDIPLETGVYVEKFDFGVPYRVTREYRHLPSDRRLRARAAAFQHVQFA